MVTSCVFTGGCRVRLLIHTSYCTLNAPRFEPRKTGKLHALSVSCVSPLQPHDSLSRINDWFSSLMSASCLGLRPPAAMTDADSRLCKLSLQLVIVMFSWSTTIALTFLEFVGEDCFGHACVFHSRDVASPAQLHLKQDRLYAWQVGFLEDLFV